MKDNNQQKCPSSNRVFFPGGTGGPPGSKNFACPPTDRRPHFLTRACYPNWVLSLKISKILPHFSLNFNYFLAQNCIRKLYFMLKTPKFDSNFAVGGIFGLSGQSFQVDSVPDGDRKSSLKASSPTKNFVKKPEQLPKSA